MSIGTETAALHYLTRQVPDAPEPMTFRKMYELGLNMMIHPNTVVGCEEFNQTPPEQRIAINLAAMSEFDDIEELRAILACALDRISELALAGVTVYRFDGAEMPEPL